jgi:uncharacterized membrane protein YGL010W
MAPTPGRDWIGEYALSHCHPANRFCHTLGIPLVVVSLGLLAASGWIEGLWPVAALLFAAGWAFQIAGHWVEGKPPEFLRDWRFLFVGLRWWWAKIRGRA